MSMRKTRLVEKSLEKMRVRLFCPFSAALSIRSVNGPAKLASHVLYPYLDTVQRQLSPGEPTRTVVD